MTAPIHQLPFRSGTVAGDATTPVGVPERRGASTAESNREGDPKSSSSLVPMLITGLVMTVLGMIAALALS